MYLELLSYVLDNLIVHVFPISRARKNMDGTDASEQSIQVKPSFVPEINPTDPWAAEVHLLRMFPDAGDPQST